MMVVAHNILAQNAAYIDKSTNDKLIKSTKKLTSGLKINSAADDAAHLSISEKMRKQIRGLDRGSDNIMEGVGYCQTADGALSEVHSMLQRMNELAVEAANGTNADSDRQSIDDEVQQLKSEIKRICVSTRYNEEYIFRSEEEDEKAEEKEKYRLSFYGVAKDLYVYNDSYNPVDQTATYGGIAYNGKRYAWSTIDPNMYDATTATFREGRYLFRADDNTMYTLSCQNGTEPPTLKREYYTQASTNGIIIGGERISWGDVTTKDGVSMDPDDIRDETYSFNYRGVIVSFKPDLDDDFQDIVHRLDGTVWQSENRIPTEQTALFADFSGNSMPFYENDLVKKYLEGTLGDLEIKAGDGTNGKDGIWIEWDGQELTDSFKSWADLGITNWGDQSEDIWEDKLYTYAYNKIGNINFTFHMINETSKDSVIQALNGVKLQTTSLYLDNGADAELTASADIHLVGFKQLNDNVSFSLSDEYGLGRDYAQAQHVFANADLVFDDATNIFSVSYSNTVDGNTTTKKFENTSTSTDTLIYGIKQQMDRSYNALMNMIKARYFAGATKYKAFSLTDVIGSGKITGGGGNSYLKETFTFDSADTVNWKSTQATSGSKEFACATIDFSELGTAYNLMDLIGTGFNATCATCDNHYSVQFVTDESVNSSVSWQDVDINGETYRYRKVDSGVNHTLLIDLKSMEQNGKTNGKDFTNVLVDIISATRYAYHYNQFATGTNDAKLILFDNRTGYVQGGASTAVDATFAPIAFDADSVANFNITLNSADSGNFTLHYEYDFSNLFDRVEPIGTVNSGGAYVKDPVSGRYVQYDKSNPAHTAPGVERYDVTFSINTNGQTLDDYMTEFAKETILKSVAGGATKVNLYSDYSGRRLSGDEKNNEAMVTEQSTPYQIIEQELKDAEPKELLRIQCSSNTKDDLNIIKQKLSLSRLGIRSCSTVTESGANKAIRMSGAALKKVNEVRGRFGAYQNRLEHAFQINQGTSENTQSAESQMRDTDMAKEIMQNSALRLIQQSGQAMLAQANQQTNMVMNLLQ